VAPANALLIIVSAAVILTALVSLVVVQSRAARNRAAEVKKQELLRIQDSVRQANRALQDSIASAAGIGKEVSDLYAEISREEQRFNSTYADMTKGRPTPEQVSQAGMVQSEIIRLRQLVSSLGATVRESERKKTRAEIDEAKARLRRLISEFGSAPRTKTKSRTESKREAKPAGKEPSGRPPSGRRPHTKDGR
jgi:uncharacterized protein YycO